MSSADSSADSLQACAAQHSTARVLSMIQTKTCAQRVGMPWVWPCGVPQHNGSCWQMSKCTPGVPRLTRLRRRRPLLPCSCRTPAHALSAHPQPAPATQQPAVHSISSYTGAKGGYEACGAQLCSGCRLHVLAYLRSLLLACLWQCFCANSNGRADAETLPSPDSTTPQAAVATMQPAPLSH